MCKGKKEIKKSMRNPIVESMKLPCTTSYAPGIRYPAICLSWFFLKVSFFQHESLGWEYMEKEEH